MKTTETLTRRRLVALGGGTIGTALAGCLGRPEPSGPPPTSDSEFLRELSFEGPDLVVKLKEDHAVSHLNLIAPDGSRFGQTTVPVGATTARIELLDIKPERAGLKHYTPGEHELVAVSESESRSVPVDLVPELRIVDVWQYRDGSKASDYGKLVVEVENVGTGPTWVYDVTNEDAPNYSANAALGEDPGIPLLSRPEAPEDLIVVPQESVQFTGVTLPFVFSGGDPPSCEDRIEMSVIVGSPIIVSLEQRLIVSISGEAIPAGLTDEYTCSNISIQLIEEDGESA